MGGGKWPNISVEYLIRMGQKGKLKIIGSRWTVLWVFQGNLLGPWKKCVCLFCIAMKLMACWVAPVLVYDCYAISHNLAGICYWFVISLDLLGPVGFHFQLHHFHFSEHRFWQTENNMLNKVLIYEECWFCCCCCCCCFCLCGLLLVHFILRSIWE